MAYLLDEIGGQVFAFDEGEDAAAEQAAGGTLAVGHGGGVAIGDAPSGGRDFRRVARKDWRCF